MDKNSLTYGNFEGCGSCKVSANCVVNNLVMWENRVNTHTHTLSLSLSYRAYFAKYISNIKELAEPFPAVFQLNQSNLCFRNGAPPLHVAVPEALYHITALPVGTDRALLETPYFRFNY